MKTEINKIAIALTFTPNTSSLINISQNICRIFNTELIFITICEKNKENSNKIDDFIKSFKIKKENLIWEEGDPADKLLSIAKNTNIDLLILGALEKETIVKYYIGSVARKIMRKSEFSLLVISEPHKAENGFLDICISVDYSTESEKALINGFKIYKDKNDSKLTVVRDFRVPGLAIAVSDFGKAEENDNARNIWIKEEIYKLKLFVKEMNIKDADIKYKALYGKEGWVASNYVADSDKDLFVITGKKNNFIDRIITHKNEYIFKKLPTNTLIIKK